MWVPTFQAGHGWTSPLARRRHRNRRGRREGDGLASAPITSASTVGSAAAQESRLGLDMEDKLFVVQLWASKDEPQSERWVDAAHRAAQLETPSRGYRHPA